MRMFIGMISMLLLFNQLVLVVAINVHIPSLDERTSKLIYLEKDGNMHHLNEYHRNNDILSSSLEESPFRINAEASRIPWWRKLFRRTRRSKEIDIYSKEIEDVKAITTSSPIYASDFDTTKENYPPVSISISASDLECGVTKSCQAEEEGVVSGQLGVKKLKVLFSWKRQFLVLIVTLLFATNIALVFVRCF